MRSKVIVGALCVVGAAASTLVVAQSGPARLTVSPNVRVIPGLHNEPWIAISPTNPKVMIAVAQGGAGNLQGGGMRVSTVISRDGGRTWATVNLPQPAETPFDPMVGIGPNGELYVMHGVIGGDFLKLFGTTGPPRATIRIWSSTDDGWTWGAPTDLSASVAPDHMRMVVDMTTGPRRGRVYVAWNDVVDQFTKNQYEVFLHYSDNQGKTFSEPILVATDTGGKLVATEPVVLSDGTLLVTWYQYFNPLSRAENEKMPFYVRRSTDGGHTFGPREKAFAFGPHIARHRVVEFPSAFALPIITADTASRSRHRDQLYVTWDDARTGESNIWFVRSTDRGRTWSAPKRINDNPAANPLGVPDYRQTSVVATAPNGDIGILWYDRRDDPARRCWNLYFARSTDGGETFGPNQKVSTAASCPPPATAPVALVHNLSPRQRDPNLPPDSVIARMSTMQTFFVQNALMNQRVRDEAEAGLPNGRLTLSFGPSRNMSPGHYTGLAADRDGAFHGLWLDRRGGTQELYTARISPSSSLVLDGAPTDVTAKVEVVAGTPTFDPATGTVKVQVQVRNVSDQAVGGPLSLKVVAVSSVQGKSAAAFGDSGRASSSMPTFSFAGKLGSADRLEPGDISEPLEIVVKVKAETGFDAALDFRVMGVVARR